jgi:SAM-dependent methyltransferase
VTKARTKEPSHDALHRSDDSHPFYRMPEVYDILHAAGTAAEVSGLERIARKYSAPPKDRASTWLEPACGTARYLRVAHKRGHNVVGIDSSPEMVAYARARLGSAKSPTARILLGDITDFSTLVPARSIDFAFNLINSIRHLPDDKSMLAHFEQMSRALKPGAVYALGLGLASYGLEIPTEDIWLGKRGACSIRQCVQYLPAETGRNKRARMERCINHLTITRPSRTDEIDFVYDLRSYDLKQWTRLVSKSALAITRAVDEEGNEITATEPGYAIFLFRAR